MYTMTFITIGLLIFAYGLISKRLEASVVTPPMVFVTLGFLLCPKMIGLANLGEHEEFIRLLAELTLVLVLFTDAARIKIKSLKQEHDIPIRLLSIGMPLTILLGTVLAAWMFDVLTFFEAAVIAAILAPTDAALGQAVVSDQRIPARMRQALNVESGLNDGIALPVVLILLATASMQETLTFGHWAVFTAKQVVLGPLVGMCIGYFGGKLLIASLKKGWMNHSYQQLIGLSLALLSYAGAEFVEGNGFIAAFCAGLTIGNIVHEKACQSIYDFAEAEGQLLELLTFFILGNVFLTKNFAHVNGSIVLYGILSLTVVRMVPVAVSLIGKKLGKKTVVFLGWFGPRGIASLLFGLIILEHMELQNREEMFLIIIATVFISIFAHGFTALPAVEWFIGRTDQGVKTK